MSTATRPARGTALASMSEDGLRALVDLAPEPGRLASHGVKTLVGLAALVLMAGSLNAADTLPADTIAKLLCAGVLVLAAAFACVDLSAATRGDRADRARAELMAREHLALAFGPGETPGADVRERALNEYRNQASAVVGVGLPGTACAHRQRRQGWAAAGVMSAAFGSLLAMSTVVVPWMKATQSEADRAALVGQLPDDPTRWELWSIPLLATGTWPVAAAAAILMVTGLAMMWRYRESAPTV